ncbi:DUF1499 domain-containing protein [uncultured Ferrovibrio sp.]|jgi:hypothetical protein|uniref:DUF1499 domain-containing protein n=1 Tax=uncultured Ferrovibrio sp. TaxID=1576913 RepID=UPI00262D92B8|nr:DUF1499 domain-containing protein [uncultured Ferrovibrio sp.]
MTLIDLRQLAQVQPGNQCWISPRGFAWLPPHRVAPEYDVPPQRLKDALRAVLAEEPHITWGETSADGLRFDLVQRRGFFRLPDLISVEILPVRDANGSASRSTLAIFSRSKYGWQNSSVNRDRVKRWLAALPARLEQADQRM